MQFISWDIFDHMILSSSSQKCTRNKNIKRFNVFSKKLNGGAWKKSSSKHLRSISDIIDQESELSDISITRLQSK